MHEINRTWCNERNEDSFLFSTLLIRLWKPIIQPDSNNNYNVIQFYYLKTDQRRISNELTNKK